MLTITELTFFLYMTIFFNFGRSSASQLRRKEIDPVLRKTGPETCTWGTSKPDNGSPTQTPSRVIVAELNTKDE
jgi:hypothetical protein